MRLIIILLVNLLLVTCHTAWADDVVKNDAPILATADDGLRAELLLYAMSLIGTSYKLTNSIIIKRIQRKEKYR